MRRERSGARAAPADGALSPFLRGVPWMIGGRPAYEFECQVACQGIPVASAARTIQDLVPALPA